MKVLRFAVLAIGLFGLGAFWGYLGYPITTWQYWAMMGFLALVLVAEYIR